MEGFFCRDFWKVCVFRSTSLIWIDKSDPLSPNKNHEIQWLNELQIYSQQIVDI